MSWRSHPYFSVGVPAGVFGVVGELDGASGATLDGSGIGVIGIGVIGAGVIGTGVIGAEVVGAEVGGAPAGYGAGVTNGVVPPPVGDAVVPIGFVEGLSGWVAFPLRFVPRIEVLNIKDAIRNVEIFMRYPTIFNPMIQQPSFLDSALRLFTL
jgi:hypothetical protein